MLGHQNPAYKELNQHLVEKSRFIARTDIETGHFLSDEQNELQRRMLPTLKSSLIEISYTLEVQILHASSFYVNVSGLPKVEVPIAVTLDSKGVAILEMPKEFQIQVQNN
jgi:hypothetical protein